MKFSVLGFLFFGCCACGSSDSEIKQQQMLLQIQEKLDATNQLVDSLLSLKAETKQDFLEKKQDSVIKKEPLNDLRIAYSKKEKDSTRIEKSQPVPEEQLKFYYKGNNKLSMEIICLEGRSMDFVLYDPWGNETYRLEHRILSYTETVEIVEWHPNGAVAKAVVHMNPGASMYWYETTYTFGINNEPEWRVSQQFPERTVTLPGENSYYWNKKTKSWVKQEVAIEQITPTN
jgi:hypothetical protein